MAQESPNRMVEWLLLVRQQVPEVRRRLQEWVDACREQPQLIWATPAVRYLTYGVGAVIATEIVVILVGWFSIPLPASARPAATTADFHVVCINPDCGAHFLVNRKFGYHGFPVTCPTCHQVTGMQARQCNSPTCGGRWVAPERREGRLQCPRCGGLLE